MGFHLGVRPGSRSPSSISRSITPEDHKVQPSVKIVRGKRSR